MWNYPVKLEAAEEGGFVVSFPDVPEAITQGDSEAEALAHAQDALETALEFYIDAGRDLPKPSAAKRRQKVIAPCALSSIKLAVYQAMRDEGLRKADLARRLGFHPPQVDRLFDLKHASKLNQLEAALAAMGRTLEVSVQERHAA